ncbi:cyclic nucleotide-regulated FAD-dependent pyridine nucleotide-disulfide oxidoreductase [Paraburkholderia sp. RAU2J]|uniref:FAD-dependent oxidoreductase n=1 Tax=Paraburkholderia sp. RAU2J TaxID=1938810 RepID=UPI000EB4ED81|nr:FAD-dependent oxidoreductase [Paraburkholderia sp. RAU2J]RKT10323.1 cyclic nucleotide-regulated FAD-dependent pyridine nucleotide-disulfide oxidoreductase [Paraburkholderia sp. RAU2J]
MNHSPDTDDTNGVSSLQPNPESDPHASRRQQKYPVLSDAEIARIARFGDVCHWRDGTRIFKVADPGFGMYVVLSGRIKVTRRDAFDRQLVINEQGPGHFVSEVGQISSGRCLVDGEAAGDVRALHVPPERLRALLIAEAELGERILRALILRRVGLIEGGSGLILVTKANNAKLNSLQSFLARNNVPHTVVNTASDGDMAQYVGKWAADDSDYPLVLSPNGTILRAPSESELATALGWLPEFVAGEVFDVAVVGAGPAGLATAVYAASEGLRVAVFDHRAPGGQAGASARIENFFGFPTGISGHALTARAFVQAQKFGARVAIPAEVESLDCAASPLRLRLRSGVEISARTVVIASGAAYRKPDIQGLERFEGKGAYYWVSPVEAKACAGKDVLLIGAGNSAGQAAVYLASHARRVGMLVRGRDLKSSMSQYLVERIASLENIDVQYNTQITALHGAENLESVEIVRDGQCTVSPTEHVFLFIGASPNTAWLSGCGVLVERSGFVLTGQAAAAQSSEHETSIGGVFCAGDVRFGSTKRVAAAVGDGAAVVSQIHQHLDQTSTQA